MRSERVSAARPIVAAGGLLWRNEPSGALIAIVHRSRYDDWVLPKGKLKPGESWEDAAVREVREETGSDVAVLGFAGAIAYETTKGVKTVRFWNMTPRSEVRTEPDPQEVMEVLWIPPLQALEMLSYPLERIMVETWHPNVPAT